MTFVFPTCICHCNLSLILMKHFSSDEFLLQFHHFKFTYSKNKTVDCIKLYVWNKLCLHLSLRCVFVWICIWTNCCSCSSHSFVCYPFIQLERMKQKKTLCQTTSDMFSICFDRIIFHKCI